MELLATIQEHLGIADNPAAVLAAGWDAFEFVREAAAAQAQKTSDGYATWMSVMPPACEGRDALGRAALMPDRPSQDWPRKILVTGTDDEIAGDLAALAALLARRLRGGAERAARPEDQQAMRRGARAAEEILELLADDG